MENSKKIWMWAGIAAAVILVAAGVWYFLGGSGSTSAVPDVVGMSAGDAVRELEDAGFKLGTSSTTTDTAVAAGAVVDQAPAAGTKAEKGSAVAITVSAKAETIAVPDVTGKDASAAADAITAAGLVPVIYRDYNAAPSNTVFAQVPDADDQVAPGTTVAIGVSSGTAPTNPKVPNVVGKTRDAATSTLEKAGFKVQRYESYNSTVAAGTVFAQFPPPTRRCWRGPRWASASRRARRPRLPRLPARPHSPRT